ncbi:MAG: hypothetical protein ACKOTH_00985, partial [Solirubrobacterales bacterium]
MAIDLKRTARGALAGAVAAGVWAIQQPIDKRLFGVPYDDVELLGKFATRGRAWPLVGAAMHLANGALFGALYANVAPYVPLGPCREWHVGRNVGVDRAEERPVGQVHCGPHQRPGPAAGGELAQQLDV